MLSSEAATLKYVRAHSTIPVPGVYSYSASHDNDIGIPYIMMSKAAGRPLSEYNWFSDLFDSVTLDEDVHDIPLQPISKAAKEKVMRQLGTIASQLLNIRLEKIGSLFEDSHGNYQVGECLSPSLLWQWRDSLEGMNRGPFNTDGEYLDSLTSTFISHAKELPLTPHAFFAPIPAMTEYLTMTSFRSASNRWNDFVMLGQKIDSSTNRLSYCIAGQILRETIPRMSVPSERGFPLSHPDLHAGNIFVNDDFDISCIIDWGSASSVPIPEVLAVPGLGNSNPPPSEPLVAAFRSSLTSERIEPDWWDKADLMWSFQRLVRLLSTRVYDHFIRLYSLAYQSDSDNPDDIPSVFRQYAAQEGNKQLLAELKEDDLTEEQVKREEKLAFGDDASEKVAIARKLTLMSEMSQGFIADKRLWQWIEDALKTQHQ